MEKRQRLRLVHILQSLALSVLAGVLAAILHLFLLDEFASLADRLAILGQYWIGGLLVFVLACLGMFLPDDLIPVIRSLKRLRVHFGILVKVVIGTMTYLLLLFNWPYSKEYSLANYIYAIVVLFICCVVGLFAGYVLACLFKKLRRQERRVVPQQSEEKGLDVWIADDQPIEHESESLFASHSGVARRIMKRLLSEYAETSYILPSVALIGPYGSGKTTICNLVEDIYCKDKKESDLPEMIFCRFEAWQFLSAEAAVRNLIEVTAGKIQELVDIAALWRIPEKYIEAIKYSGSWWTKLIGTLLGGSHNTQEIISDIGDTLLRLDVRLVIFVDDFDRIEEESFATQQAIAKALNQLQNLPNTQYVISVGPTTNTKKTGNFGMCSWDLLKLTRFQELVPKVDPEEVIKLTKQLRERALKNEDYYLPWSETKENEKDPLTWHPELAHLYSQIGFLGRLIRLVNTPRILKCTLRESNQAWEGGLKGEIDWHDLILANALKTAEPGVFEWIARDREIFIESVVEPLRLPNASKPESQEAQIYAKELEQHLIERVGSKDPSRYEIVKEAVCELFPVFETKLKATESWSGPVPQWSQKICLRPNHGADYIERFFAGCVPESDIPDQPTLQYIQRIIELQGTTIGEFNLREFESLFLNSSEKLTGPLNKIVQFSGLIPNNIAYKICDIIFDWIAEPKHAEYWPEPDRFIFAVLPDVFTIVDNAGRRERKSKPFDSGVADEREKWLIKIVQIHAQKTPLLAAFIVQGAIEKGYKGADKFPDELLRHFNAVFVQGKKPLLSSLGISRFALAWLLLELSKYDGYQEFKADFTNNIIAEADNESKTELRERILFSLVSTTTPARSVKIRPDEYHFSVEKAVNEQRYDMDSIKGALQKWHAVTWSDEIANRAFLRLASEYNIP